MGAGWPGGSGDLNHSRLPSLARPAASIGLQWQRPAPLRTVRLRPSAQADLLHFYFFFFLRSFDRIAHFFVACAATGSNITARAGNITKSLMWFHGIAREGYGWTETLRKRGGSPREGRDIQRTSFRIPLGADGNENDTYYTCHKDKTRSRRTGSRGLAARPEE